ncbi:helix-turn-helix domain-containing protein [Marinoscillum furvescens]|uniref:AraC-like DNA-binding protein n=1 Tax=Marinoscillum furvescens DSM 4134 TaxID=1122208 RepID=A0A3D9L6V9_MARFU|nr:AraC family transcriptional regulator [Marinoscillum furvescens]REE02091.1 AraC-like DNA-binding protein [Marinoscillum furvescens DSM 4134]
MDFSGILFLLTSLLLAGGLLVFLLRKRKPVIIADEVELLNEKEAAFRKIDHWIKSDKRFLDPALKLDRVARGVHLSEREVSSAINTIACENFNAYINRWRIKEAKCLLTDDSHSHFTVDAIAEMVGFANKVSFYKAFKRVTGTSPTEFRRQVKQAT